MPGLLQQAPAQSKELEVLIASHGDLDLAAERLKTSPTSLLASLAALPPDLLASAIRTSLLLSTFLSAAQFKIALEVQLGDLAPQALAKLYTETLQLLIALTAPVQANQNTINIQNVMNQMEPEHARAALIERINQLAPSSEEGRTNVIIEQ
jgi:hypothetical protein